jgi:hypothetical protein
MINLGQTVRDTITGLEGVAIARTEWLYGCIRITIQPRGLHDGKPVESQCFDEAQLVAVEAEKVPGDVNGEHRAGPKPSPSRRADPGR